MIKYNHNGKPYKIPNGLNEFQLSLYLHLIDWKWQQGITQPGTSHGHEYDAILPEAMAALETWPHLYPDIHAPLKAHRRKNDFRIHKHFYHMASSQAANLNLFLPILHHPDAHRVLAAIKPDFASLATDQLDNGYCIEFWGGNLSAESAGKGLLGDKSAIAGTDSDIAIAYRNHQGELCLWLIEHKLTEAEFTSCGGYKSKRRDKKRHDCSKSFAEVLATKANCYYHDVRKFAYWKITEANQKFFPNHESFSSCPLKGGMNQLWRNQLLALALEQEQQRPYQQVTFSVVHHPDNHHLDASIDSYRNLIGDSPKFSVFTSADVVTAAESIHDMNLDSWSKWYRGLYCL